MNKKKAIKVLGASAIAASAFVATTPASADAAANDVQSLVKNAKDAGTVLKWAISTEGSADGTTRPWAQYNAAKAARDAAVVAINKLPAAQKAGYLADIEQNVNLHIDRTMHYIDAITAGEKINVKKADLQKQIDANLINDDTEAAYHALSTEIRKQAILLDRVYGKSTRDEIRANYKKSAEALRDSVKYAVTVKIELDRANKALEENNEAEVEKHIAEANKYINDVQNKEMKADLVKALEKAEAQLTPEVKSVSAINATQVEIAFNKAVDPATLFVNGKGGEFKENTVSVTTVEAVEAGDITGKLSKDGKTLTVTAKNALEKRYNVVVNNVKTTDGKAVVKYDEIVTSAADKTAPEILSTTKNSASSYTVKFSEPIQDLGKVTYKLSDGTTAAVTNNFQEGATEVTFTITSDVPAGKEVTATFVGAKDQAGNLLTPNPATVSFVKGDKDGVAPKVSSITQTGAKTFAVKFSEELLEAPAVKVGTTTDETVKVEKDSDNPTVYNVTVDSILDGAKTIAISTFTDLSGENGENYSKVVTFNKDEAAPAVTSTKVVTDSTDKKEYPEISFNKDVELADVATVAGTGSYVKNYVTTSVELAPEAVDFKDDDNKRVIRVELDAFLGDNDFENAAYTLDLTFAGVESAGNVGAESVKSSFTRGTDGVAVNKDVVGIDSVEQGDDNNKVEVTFNKAVDGASATNVANYKIDRAVIESVTLMQAVEGPEETTQVAVLNLKAGSNSFTGVRNIYISGVKALGSTKTMEAFHTNEETLNENVAPVLTSAKLTATNKITLTFSEAVKQEGTGNADFELLVGGKSVSPAVTFDSGLTTEASKTAEITISPVNADSIEKGLSLKGLDSIDVKDAVGNVLSVPANVTISK